MIYTQSEPSEILRQMFVQGFMVAPFSLSVEIDDITGDVTAKLNANGQFYQATWDKDGTEGPSGSTVPITATP